MPQWLQVIAKSLPLYHGVVLSQSIYWNENVLSSWLNHGPILVLYSIVLVGFSFGRVRRRLQS
jgi:hypothetical protein